MLCTCRVHCTSSSKNIPRGFEISISNKFQSLVTIWQKKLKIQQKKLKIQQKNSRFNKKNSRTQNRLLGKCAAGYLLPICPNKLPAGCRSIFSRKYDCAVKKNSRIKKKTQDIKKTQESQIACLGSARLVTCCQLVQTSSRMVVVRYFRENTIVLRKKTQEPRKKLKV